jgi:putative addiction module CopG family antidote
MGCALKNISISLTDQHAAEIQACIASGDFASVSEVIRAALREFLNAPIGPSMEQINKDIREFEAHMAAGGKTYTIEEVRQNILNTIRE